MSNESTSVNPKRRDMVGGLVVLLICGGVVLSRGGSPDQGFADQAPGLAEQVTSEAGAGAVSSDAEVETSIDELLPPVDAVAPGLTSVPSTLVCC